MEILSTNVSLRHFGIASKTNYPNNSINTFRRPHIRHSPCFIETRNNIPQNSKLYLPKNIRSTNIAGKHMWHWLDGLLSLLVPQIARHSRMLNTNSASIGHTNMCFLVRRNPICISQQQQNNKTYRKPHTRATGTYIWNIVQICNLAAPLQYFVAIVGVCDIGSCIVSSIVELFQKQQIAWNARIHWVR